MSVRALALILFFSAWLAGVPLAAEAPAVLSPAPEERAAFDAAIEALRTGDWVSAVQGFRIASGEAWVLSDYARFFLAESLSRLGDLTGARQAVESLTINEPDSRLVPAALLLAAHLASREGDEAAAERLLREFLSRVSSGPEAARARYLLGLTLEAQGRDVEALSTFRETWLLAPANPYGEAAGDHLDLLVERGVVLPPLTEEERVERAERLSAGNSPAAAREAAEALLAGRPAPELAFRALAVATQALRRLGRYTDAARLVEHSLTLTPLSRRPQLLLEVARLRERAGAKELALATLDRLIQQFPKERDTAWALTMRARAFEEAGRWGEATRAYRKVTLEFVGHEAGALALWRLGWIAYLGGDYARAAREFERLVDLPVGQGYRLGSAYWAGRSREARGEQKEARRLFRLVLNEGPKSYYGILVARRIGAAANAPDKPPPVDLPSDPLAPLATEVRFVKAEILRALGLREYADAELEVLAARSIADPVKLYGLCTLWVREEEYHRALRILRRYLGDLALSGHPGLPRRFWEMVYPIGWKRELEEASARTGMDRYFLAAVVREESSFFPQARSRTGARGLMQLMPETARALAQRRGLAVGDDAELLEDPGLNLELGTEFLATLLREFGDPRLAAAAYNAGPTRVREWWGARRSEDLEVFVEQIPFDETRQFVKRIVVSWEEYRRIYGANG